jgi:hypothetical protein
MLTFVLGAAGAESMKSARIGAFAVVLAVAERGENVFQGGR